MNSLDRNWHWVIVFASFMCHVVCDGITYSFGVLNPELLHQFHAGVATTSWVSSILIGVTLGAGPIAGALANHFGCRKVVIAGSVIAMVGSIASVYATSIYHLMFTVGFIMGSGFSLMFCPSVIIVNLHFHKRRALAVGMVVCGAGIGTFIISPLTTFLIDRYSWRGTFWVYAGLIAQGIPFGCCYRDPPEEKIQVPDYEDEEVEVQKVSVKDPDANGDVTSEEQSEKKLGGAISFSDKNIAKPTLEMARNRCFSLMTVEEYQQGGRTVPTHYHRVKPLEHMDLFYSGFALDEDGNTETDLQIEILPRRKSMLISQKSLESEEQRSESSDQDVISDMVAGMKRLMDLSLLKDPVYLTIALSNFLTNLGYDMPRIFLPDKVVEEMHVSKEQGAWLLSIWGITSTIGRLLIGVLCDAKWAIPHRLWIYNGSLIFAGVVNVVAPLLPNYTWMAAYSGLFGLSLSTYISLTSVVLVDVLGIDKLTNAFGLLLFFQGVSAIIGPPIGGAIVDASGSYDYSFVFAGIALALSGLILVPLAIRRARSRSAPSPRLTRPHRPTLESIPE